MTFDPAKHHRRSIRLQGYDYAQAGAYFVTTCAYQRTCLFGQVENDMVVLSQCGCIAEQCWKVRPRDFPRVELDVFVVMPNHLHGIIILTGHHTAGRGEAFAILSPPCGYSVGKCFAPTIVGELQVRDAERLAAQYA
jgi:putative transposase